MNLSFFSLYNNYSYPLTFSYCRQTLPKLNFKGPYSSSEREIKFHRCLITSSIKREIRHFHVVVVQKRKRNVQKSVMHMRSLSFANWTYCFFGRSRCRPRCWILKSLIKQLIPTILLHLKVTGALKKLRNTDLI